MWIWNYSGISTATNSKNPYEREAVDFCDVLWLRSETEWWCHVNPSGNGANFLHNTIAYEICSYVISAYDIF